jgi:hypothetical protein
MNIDLGSPILDVAIGLSFVFFLLSVISSAIGEFFAGVLNLRGKNLEKGLLGMIGDREAVGSLLDHPLVRTELDKRSRVGASRFILWWDGLLPKAWRTFERASSYLAPEIFAAAFHVIYNDLKGKPAKDNPKERAEDATKKRAGMEAQMNALGKTITSEVSWQEGLEHWFDSGMERVTGWYKRKSQIITVLVAIAVAIGCNANTLRIAERLDKDPTTRSAVLVAAEGALEKPCCGQETAKEKEEAKAKEEEQEKKGEKPDATVEIEHSISHFSEATKSLGSLGTLGLPLFWGNDNQPSTMTFWENALGWFLTVVAISLGAPFWFDALGKLSNLRTTGKKPKEAGAEAEK